VSLCFVIKTCKSCVTDLLEQCKALHLIRCGVSPAFFSWEFIKPYLYETNSQIVGLLNAVRVKGPLTDIDKTIGELKENRNNDLEVKFESYDEENYILKLTGVEIKMAKKGKDNDATLLLKSLLKEETDAWKYYDDIFEEWGYHSDNLKKIHRNKVLFAVNRVNDLIAQEIQVKDFIEHQKSKVRINPKYRKVS
jgi:tRNA U34 5-carboxymethylaminomethyl modifying enzyme MnmG/GidA